MQAMIFAAGLGTRLAPYSDTLPKPLFPVDGHPLIAYPLGLLKSAGVTDVVINLHHLGDQIEEALKPCIDMGLSIHFSREDTLLETGGGLGAAQRLLSKNTFLLLNADVICDIDLGPVVESHVRSGAVATMVLTDRAEPGRYAPVEWAPRSRHVKNIREELSSTGRGTRSLVFTGIQVLEPDVFDYLMKKKESIIDAFYLPALREGRHLHGYLHSGYWADPGTLQDYARVEREIKATHFSHLKPLPLRAARAIHVAP